MKSQVTGKLKIASEKQPSFAGFRIDASFDGKHEPGLGAPMLFAASALSDEAGNFTLVFPDSREIAAETVKFTVLSPACRIIREVEVRTADLDKPLTIEMEALEVEPGVKPAPTLNTPESAAVDVLFRSDAALRQVITKNLKSRGGESEAIASRVEKAWKFNPSSFSAEERARRHYVPPGADPGEVQEQVVMSGVDAFRSANNGRAVTLRNSPELRKLIKEAPKPADSIRGVVELGPMIDFIDSKSTGSLLVAEPIYAVCKAELEAQRMLDSIETKAERGDGGEANLEDSSSKTRETDQLVKEAVNLQMKSATAPESQLAYGKIPNSADQDKVQSGILQTFELRPGASDVTSYHDFNTLQIAFEHVWTEIFDGQLASLGRDLYREYVKLKDFSGSTDTDLQVGTLADLRRLMEEVRKLSQATQDNIPDSLRPERDGKNESNVGGLVSVRPEDVARVGGAVATGGLSLVLEWAFNELIKLGNKPVIVTWNSFPLSLNAARGNIIEMSFEENALNRENVELVLETDANSFKKKIVFQQWDPDTQRTIDNVEIQNFGPGNGARDSALLNTSQIVHGTLKFISEDEIVNELLLGRYVLGDLTQVIKDRRRVTFRWKGQR